MFYGGTEHQYSQWQMRKRVAAVELQLLRHRVTGRSLDLFISHAPPYGIHDGVDPCHQGFRAFLGFIRRYGPHYHLHGHVHPAYGYDVAPKLYHDTQVRNIYGYEVLEMSL